MTEFTKIDVAITREKVVIKTDTHERVMERSEFSKQRLVGPFRKEDAERWVSILTELAVLTSDHMKP